MKLEDRASKVKKKNGKKKTEKRQNNPRDREGVLSLKHTHES